MNKDAQSEQQPGLKDAASPATQTAGPSLELRPDLKAQLLRMGPDDAGMLAEMLKLYPNLSGGIILFAASHMGNAFVQRAIAIAKSSKTQGRAAPLSHDEALVSMTRPAATLSEVDETAAPKPAQAAAEPAWVAGARAYNAAHPELVDEFNELTGDVCRLDGESKVDPQAVARWQSNHGLVPDGKIGPHTVAKARTLQAKAPEVAAAPQADARPPV